MVQKIYILENLGCANCASKIETKINALPEVAEASITFSTKQLRITANHPDLLLPKIQEIATSIEEDIIITSRQKKRSKPSSHAVTHAIPQDTCNCSSAHVHPHQEGSCSSLHTHQHEDSSCTSLHTHKDDHCSTASRSLHATKDQKRKKIFFSKEHLSEIEIISGICLFIIGKLFEKGIPLAAPPIFILAYFILGRKIVATAFKNLRKGQFFDENFLMSLATLGAFTIQNFAEAVGVMLFYRIGEFFEHRAVEKSRGQIMKTVDLRPEVVQLINNTDNVTIVAAEDVVVGDVVLIRPGDRVPLDGIILEGESRLDTSAITGESVPIKVTAGDAITSGCTNTSGLLKMRVEKVLDESMVTRILEAVENAAASKPKIDKFITKFARVYTPFVVILALFTAILPSLFTGNWHHWIYTALTFLVISCPCALVLSVPLAFFSGIGAGSKKGILFKGGVSLEAMHTLKAVVMDKTGTITEGNFVVQDILCAKEISKKQLLFLAASAELSSTHPIGTSIVNAAKKEALTLEQPSSIEEIAGAGIKAILTEGEILIGNENLMKQHSILLTEYEQKSFGTEVFVAWNKKFIGCFCIADTVKEDAFASIQKLKELGLQTAMLTGDTKTNADAIAKATGIDQVYGRLLPEDKLEILHQLQKKYGAVMFIGDGINDAPVLAGADVGAAMGSGADAAIEAADMVFMTSKMAAIPQALSISRTTNQIAKQNVIFALIIKALVMLLGLMGFASMWMAVFADTGVALLCVLNSIRILYKK